LENKKRYSIKKILLAILWVAIGAGTTVLLVAAIRKKDAATCKRIEIKITGVEKNDGPKFVDEDEILSTIKKISGGNAVGVAIGLFDLKKIEAELEKSKWVKNAELFFDNKDVLNVNLQEREPVARVFTAAGTSFYIDEELKMLPLSDKLSAKLPAFTNFPTDNIVLSAADSSLLLDVKNVSVAIQKDSFRMAMIDQVDITPERSFEMIPKIGNQVIVFGNAADVEEKFDRLQLFYKNVISKTGWSKYSVINVQFKNQVVAKIRGAEDKSADSLRTLQMMQTIAANAARESSDSVQTFVQDNNNNTADSSMIQQSIQREDNFEPNNATIDKPLQPAMAPPVFNPTPVNPTPLKTPAVAKPAVTKPVVTKPVATKPKLPDVSKPALQKPAITKPVPAKKPSSEKPKPVIQNRNDY
jgi:cell division protein FtsQ